MQTELRVVDNRTFLLGLDELYRQRIKRHEQGELRSCAIAVCQLLAVPPASGPVEGYYSEHDQLAEYFQLIRALQGVEAARRREVEHCREFKRLLEVASSPIFGKPNGGKLLPVGKDPLSLALKELWPEWTIDGLTDKAHRIALATDDHSLVGLAAVAKDPVILAALRETAVLYAMAIAGSAAEPIKLVYEWAVDPELGERATRFASAFNQLFDESLPLPIPENAAVFSEAADEAAIWGRCVRLGYDDRAEPIRHYHWAVVESAKTPGSLAVQDFWRNDLWTTERFRAKQFSNVGTAPGLTSQVN